MGFALSFIVMFVNLSLALFTFSLLSRPQRFLRRSKKWGIILTEHPEQQKKELQRLGYICLAFLFLTSVICGVVLAIIQNNIS